MIKTIRDAEQHLERGGVPIMKKLVSMLLALAMVLTLAGSAMAETKD